MVILHQSLDQDLPTPLLEGTLYRGLEKAHHNSTTFYRGSLEESLPDNTATAAAAIPDYQGSAELSGVGIVLPLTQVETAQPPDTAHPSRQQNILLGQHLLHLVREVIPSRQQGVTTTLLHLTRWRLTGQEVVKNLLHRYSVLYIQCTTTNTPDPVIRGS